MGRVEPRGTRSVSIGTMFVSTAVEPPYEAALFVPNSVSAAAISAMYVSTAC